jgi:hypothetical protein
MGGAVIQIFRVILLTASIISGEAGPVGNGVELAIARTMANRVADGQTNVLAAYYARGPVTTEAAMAATMLVLRPSTLAHGGMRYVWSDDDRRTHGWPAGDVQVCGAGLCVHFGRTFPGGGTDG